MTEALKIYVPSHDEPLFLRNINDPGSSDEEDNARTDYLKVGVGLLNFYI